MPAWNVDPFLAAILELFKVLSGFGRKQHLAATRGLQVLLIFTSMERMLGPMQELGVTVGGISSVVSSTASMAPQSSSSTHGSNTLRSGRPLGKYCNKNVEHTLVFLICCRLTEAQLGHD